MGRVQARELYNEGLFFFFKQKTAYEIGTGDWSSDVCSSDLGVIKPMQAVVGGSRKTTSFFVATTGTGVE